MFYTRELGEKVTPSARLLGHLAEDGNRKSTPYFSFRVSWFLPSLCYPSRKGFNQLPDGMCWSGQKVSQHAYQNDRNQDPVVPNIMSSSRGHGIGFVTVFLATGYCGLMPPASSLPLDSPRCPPCLPHTLCIGHASLLNAPGMSPAPSFGSPAAAFLWKLHHTHIDKLTSSQPSSLSSDVTSPVRLS